jgi:DUF4097 and DUF4098 domain-containing protein YvlB
LTATPQRTLWLAAGGLLALAFTVWAGFGLAGRSVGSVERNEHRVLRGEVSEVRIDGTSGDVTLVPSAGREVVVDSRAQGTLWLPKMETRIDGGNVSVRGECHIVVFGSCSASFVVHIPAGTPVTVTTSSGDVRASGLSGPVRLDVSSGDLELVALTGGTEAHVASGDIDARRLGGRVVLDTSSGDVQAAELTSTVAGAHADSGDVSVDLAVVPRRVSADSSSGDVTISVPRGGGEGYDTKLATSSGDPTLGVRRDPLADRSLSAVTSSGDVAIRYRDG